MVQRFQNYDYGFKVIVFGNQGVGASATISQIANGVFPTEIIPSIGIDFKIRYIFIDEKTLRLVLWDYVGYNTRIVNLDDHLGKADAIALMYDVTNLDSFEYAKKWAGRAKELAPKGAPIFIIGNKIDLVESRVVEARMGSELVEQNDIDFFEVSANSTAGLKEVVWNLVNKLIKREDKRREDHKEEVKRQEAAKSKNHKLTEDKNKSCNCF